MGIIQQAKEFVQGLFALLQHGYGKCPHCGSSWTKKNGTYKRPVRDLGCIRPIVMQRHFCHACRRTWTDQVPEVAPHKWYARRVNRKSLDLYMIGASLRSCADWITAEITGRGRTFHWDVLARLPWWGRAPEPEPEIVVSHTTIWRWLQNAGQKCRQRQDLYKEVPQSGLVVSDAAYVRIRGVKTAILGIVDGVYRTIFGLCPLKTEESGEEIERAFNRAERAGLNLEWIKVFTSDGGGGFREFLARCLPGVLHQRCIFHLWRNVLPIIARYATEKGKLWAAALQLSIAAVWNAGNRAEAEVALRLLVAVFATEAIAREAVYIVQETFEQAITYLTAGLANVGRTSNPCEWLWRYYKVRVEAMGGFMSQSGCDNFNAAWETYMNFRRYQRRKERKRQYAHIGKCPLEVAGVMVQGVTWLDALEV
jgi:transposase-like protein